MKFNRYLWQNLKPALGFVILIWIIWITEFLADLNLGVSWEFIPEEHLVCWAF